VSTERQKPFVAWSWEFMLDRLREGGAVTGRYAEFASTDEGCADLRVPVVVTPLLPDDPKPGEVWLDGDLRVTIVGAPAGDGEDRVVAVTTDGRFQPRFYTAWVHRLRRPPVLKTFRLHIDHGNYGWTSPEITAESKDDAVAKIAASLQEV
jgi:hypothetical protein